MTARSSWSQRNTRGHRPDLSTLKATLRLPSSAEEGWLRDQEKVAQPPPLAQTGAKPEPGRGEHQRKRGRELPWPHYPGRSINGGSAASSCVAATPPLLRRGARITTTPHRSTTLAAFLMARN